ncbi:TPA: class I SAM-dependent methyltransferase [Candidatus Woesearchaeota archaeon]|nr:class I SAM-dependent methyltransferase [Candidatus Woesearchaeota archaeon]HIH39506.1 class I SAM-dependent methyltransferase [Candidatus Woesearchaeota archaeon]
MNIIDKIKQVIINIFYLGKTAKEDLKDKPAPKLFEGWKKNNVAERMLKISKFDIEKINKGNIDVNIKTNIDLIKSTGLKNFSYLDVGCGVGNYNKLFKILLPNHKIEYTGVDYSKEAISLANENFKDENSKFRTADMQKLPFKNKTFDISCSSSVLPYAKNYSKAISELARVTKKYVLITRTSVTDGKEIYQRQKAYGSEWVCTLFNENKLKKITQKNGLKIIREVVLKKIDSERTEKSYILKAIR